MASGISQKFSVYCDKVIAATSRNWTDKCTHSRGEKIVGENWRNIQMYFQTFKNKIVLLLSIRYRTVQCRFVQKALKYRLSSPSVVYAIDPATGGQTTIIHDLLFGKMWIVVELFILGDKCFSFGRLFLTFCRWFITFCRYFGGPTNIGHGQWPSN